MTKLTAARLRRRGGAIAWVAIVLVGAVAFAATVVTRSQDREITLVARGMAFYFLGDPTADHYVFSVSYALRRNRSRN